MFARQAVLWAGLMVYLVAVNAVASVVYRHWVPVPVPVPSSPSPIVVPPMPTRPVAPIVPSPPTTHSSPPTAAVVRRPEKLAGDLLLVVPETNDMKDGGAAALEDELSAIYRQYQRPGAPDRLLGDVLWRVGRDGRARPWRPATPGEPNSDPLGAGPEFNPFGLLEYRPTFTAAFAAIAERTALAREPRQVRAVIVWLSSYSPDLDRSATATTIQVPREPWTGLIWVGYVQNRNKRLDAWFGWRRFTHVRSDRSYGLDRVLPDLLKHAPARGEGS